MVTKVAKGNWEHFNRAKKEVKQSHGKGRPSNKKNFEARSFSRTFVETTVIGNDEIIHQRLRPSTFASSQLDETRNEVLMKQSSAEEVKGKTFAQNLIERLED